MRSAGNMDHSPNTQAAATLLRDILPRALQMLPRGLQDEFRVHIVGSNKMPAWLAEMAATDPHHIICHGALSDEQVRLFKGELPCALSTQPFLRGFTDAHDSQTPCAQLASLYSSVRVAVAPLLSGAGVKGKASCVRLQYHAVIVLAC